MVTVAGVLIVAIAETVRQPIAGQQNKIGLGCHQRRMLQSGDNQVVIRILAVLAIARNLRTIEDPRPFRRWRLDKLAKEFRIIERVEVEIGETQDDPDIRFSADITHVRRGGCLASTRTTHQEYKHYEYGSAQGLQIFCQ